ncbi:MAG: phosphate--AMP phosphotransferase [Defluviitaleaceae bacterium]|nr:phosphate--AMP phosphotransferase [Defluviitaleaceae bacterium]
MLSDIDLQLSLDKKHYKSSLRELEVTLANLQQTLRETEIPVIIVFEGWGASGKGTSIARMVNALDPRYFDVRTTGKTNEEKLMRPFLWSFWTYLPSRGQIVILDKSWHRLIMPHVRDSWGISDTEAYGFYYDVNAFERQLADDGALIIKLFLHISQDEQKRRFKALEKDPTTAWRVKPHDWEQNKNYSKNLQIFEKILQRTQTKNNPWHIIEAEDRKYATVKILRTIITAIKNRLDSGNGVSQNTGLQAPIYGNFNPKCGIDIAMASECDSIANDKNPHSQLNAQYVNESGSYPRILQGVSPYRSICDMEYDDELAYYQQRMRMLGNKLYAKRRSAVIVYEGWDAAGKGGNIKRLTSELDPRCYAVVPIGAPRPYELARHYLWRFMVKMPKDGHMTIFDRSWYGRVLIERVDQLTPEHIWRRAYKEINEMEQHLVNHGVILLKFWMHVDKDEQFRRLTARQNSPEKQHKITPEDWRNHEKRPEYEQAVDEMLAHTQNPHAPWVIVESNNKKFARIKTLKTVTDTLNSALM